MTAAASEPPAARRPYDSPVRRQRASETRERILDVISNPNIAYILMMIGIYGLIFEFMNPGALVPGTIGAICLLAGLYALALLPVNYAGLGLIVLGLGLMVAEAFTPSFGILGVGGVAAFALGAAILVDTEAPDFQISWAVIGAVAAWLQGSPSVTLDLDVMPRRDLDNAERLASALNALSAQPRGSDKPTELEGADFLGWRSQSFDTDAGPIDVVPHALDLLTGGRPH